MTAPPSYLREFTSKVLKLEAVWLCKELSSILLFPLLFLLQLLEWWFNVMIQVSTMTLESICATQGKEKVRIVVAEML
jgi:hypothetical protein